jgi:hypothetical protein
MTPQETKALLDVLNRIATALEGKDKNIPEKIVNRFAEVYQMLLASEKTCRMNGQPGMADEILKIEITHVEIANEILSIYSKK